MAGIYSQNFTLKDLFGNKKLRGKLPLINYKEVDLGEGKISARTNTKSVSRLVYDISVSSARPFYAPLSASKMGDTILIGGNLMATQNEVVEAIYNNLLAKRMIMVYTANNVGIIRDALKESERVRRETGKDVKLFLRANSMLQIENMSKKQIQALMIDIMENIRYNRDFGKIQDKYKLNTQQASSELFIDYEKGEIRRKNTSSYERLREDWQRRVGDYRE